MRYAAVLAGLALGLGAAACGGDDGDDEVTRESYIAAADKFCAEQNVEAKKRNTELQQIASESHSEREFLGKVVPALEEGLEWTRDQQVEFEKIEPPAADRATIDKLTAAIEAEIVVLERVVAAARDRDFDKFATLAGEQQKLDDRVDALARDYGLKECGNDDNEADAPPDA